MSSGAGCWLQRLYGTDSKGLVTTSRGDKLPAHKLLVARRDDTPNMKTLAEVVQHVKPNVLIGLAGAGPAFEQVCAPVLLVVVSNDKHQSCGIAWAILHAQ